jgi:hypothetical protein
LSPNDWKASEWKLSPRNWSKSTHENFEDKLEPYFFPFQRKHGDGINWVQQVHNMEREACLAGQQSIYVIGTPSEDEVGPPAAKRSRTLIEPPRPAMGNGGAPFIGGISGLLEDPSQGLMPIAASPAIMGTAKGGTKMVHGHVVEKVNTPVAMESQAAQARSKKKCCWECKNEKKSRKECRLELQHIGPEFDKDPRHKEGETNESPSHEAPKKGPAPRRGKGGTGPAHEANAGISLLAHAATSLLSIPAADGSQEFVPVTQVAPLVNHHGMPRTPRHHEAQQQLLPNLSEQEDGSRNVPNMDLDNKPWGHADEVSTPTAFSMAPLTSSSSFSRPCVSRGATTPLSAKPDDPVSSDKSAMTRPQIGDFGVVEDGDLLAEPQDAAQALALALNEAERAGAMDVQEARRFLSECPFMRVFDTCSFAMCKHGDVYSRFCLFRFGSGRLHGWSAATSVTNALAERHGMDGGAHSLCT